MFHRTLAVVLLMCPNTFADEQQSRILFDFTEAKAGTQWQSVNDGVMGGRSDGRFRIANEKSMEFFGTLSLDNNGGFASVRSRPRELDLRENDTVVIRVKSDGRRYTLNLYVPSPRIAYSYRVEFDTKNDRWTEVRLPLNMFVATSFGRIVSDAGPVNPKRVNSIGFLLGDKKAGPFKLEIDWIKAESPSDSNVTQATGST